MENNKKNIGGITVIKVAVILICFPMFFLVNHTYTSFLYLLFLSAGSIIALLTQNIEELKTILFDRLLKLNFSSSTMLSGGVQYTFNEPKTLDNNTLKKNAKDKNKGCSSQFFSEIENDFLDNPSRETLSILSYFATSLFGKNNTDEVLWDIVENCISQLHLEDCVIYILDKQKKVLNQKTAYGNKNNGQKKVISPIQIKVGEGIVGCVAQTGTYRCVKDVTLNSNYIIDDAQRMSELSVPIFIEDELIGVLDSEHSQKDFFTQEHIFLFHLIAKLTEKKLTHIYAKTACNITSNNVYFKELDFLMKEAKIYRDPNLGLDSMAQKLKISSNYLSQLVNKLAHQNFADYVNGFRIEDAKSKLRNSKFIHYTVISIGLESGFNSKSTFYSAFKKLVGVSPSTYRKS
ncbi:helix-turn-helix domain-containing protein [Aquimarina sp. AU474]|uniref:helix-turn-helix domain-containing protein n=1 Tax=Aquimarina sp. AU474 TaxID=2108529 RepID=UPI000D68A6CA|nr:helix-turn-helix domain-containing protein [Aquimarina sp. AU474]